MFADTAGSLWQPYVDVLPNLWPRPWRIISRNGPSGVDEWLLALLDATRYSATYKHATLLALIDVIAEHTAAGKHARIHAVGSLHSQALESGQRSLTRIDVTPCMRRSGGGRGSL